jgi:hypothetical protein
MQTLQKIDMALEQLEDALEAYFKERYHSATVLAGAAEQLFAGYLHKHGLKPAWIEDRAIITKIANGLRSDPNERPTTEDDIGGLMNRAYNSSKHAGKTDHEIEMDAREESQRVIDRAISNYDQLFTRVEHDLRDVPLAQRFREESISNIRVERNAG